MLEVHVRFGTETFYASRKRRSRSSLQREKMRVRRCSIDQNNAAPERRHPESRMRVRVVDKARSFRPCGRQCTEIGSCTIGMGPVLMSIVAGRDREWPSPFPRLIIFPPVLKKRDSVRQSNQASTRGRDPPPNCQTNQSNENPYRAGQPFAGPASSRRTRFKFLFEEQSHTVAQLLPLDEACPCEHRYCHRPSDGRSACSGSAPRKTRIERRSSAGFFQDHQKSKREKFRANVALPARDDLTWMRPQQDTRDPANCASRLVHRSRLNGMMFRRRTSPWTTGTTLSRRDREREK